MRDFCVEDTNLTAHSRPEGCTDTLGIVGSPIYHSQQDAVNAEIRIDIPLHLGYGTHQQIQTFGGQKIRACGDDYTVGGYQRIDGHHTQGGGTVDQNVVVLVGELRKGFAEYLFTAHGVKQADFQTGQLDV